MAITASVNITGTEEAQDVRRTTVSREAAIAMQEACAQLSLECPFFSVIVDRLNIVERWYSTTAATDGFNLYYNPKFILDASPRERIGLVAHEAAHVFGGHGFRRGDRHPGIWNDACDYAINEILIYAGFELPEDPLLDHAYAGMAPEKIYDIIYRPPSSGEDDDCRNGDQCDDNSTVSWDGVWDHPIQDFAEITEPKTQGELDDLRTGAAERSTNDTEAHNEGFMTLEAHWQRVLRQEKGADKQ